jgi:hypothetical protein
MVMGSNASWTVKAGNKKNRKNAKHSRIKRSLVDRRLVPREAGLAADSVNVFSPLEPGANRQS